MLIGTVIFRGCRAEHRPIPPRGCFAPICGDFTAVRPRFLVPSSLFAIMGRPKVLPANRLRANTACTACRASKKRCSGSFPCTNCIHKGRGHTCIPFKSISATESRSRRESTVSRQPIESIPTAWSELSANIQNIQSPRSSQIQDASPSDRHIQRPLEAGSRSPEATHRTHPRMLRNLQGERGAFRRSSDRYQSRQICSNSGRSVCR